MQNFIFTTLQCKCVACGYIFPWSWFSTWTTVVDCTMTILIDSWEVIGALHNMTVGVTYLRPCKLSIQVQISCEIKFCFNFPSRNKLLPIEINRAAPTAKFDSWATCLFVGLQRGQTGDAKGCKDKIFIREYNPETKNTIRFPMAQQC